MQKEVRLTIPADLTTVRGILLVSNGAGGDTREGYKEVWYEAFIRWHDFAFLGAKGFTSHTQSVQVLRHALKQIAQDSRHPELVNVPYAATGFSAGGGFAARLLVELPERVIASVPVCSRLNFTGVTPNAANLATPACIISGELEKGFPSIVEPVLAAHRPKGGLFGWMTVQGAGHTRIGQEVLAMPLLDTCVRLRYPKDGNVRTGPLKLKPIAAESGWLADNTTWKSGLTRIAPATGFRGDLGATSWLPSEDIAFIYRAYATYDPALTIIAPQSSWPQPGWNRQRFWEPGSDVALVVDDTQFPHWRKLEFYDGARKLGEIGSGSPQLMARKLPAGYHVFSVLGTDEQGKLRTSNPVLVIVAKLPGRAAEGRSSR